METKSLSRQRDFSYYINPYTNLKANETSGDPNRLTPINGKLFKKIGIKEEWLE